MSNQNNLTPNQQKELDELTWKLTFQQKVMEELKSNKATQDYFKDFTPDSVSSFIETYALFKSNWHQHGKFWMKVKDEHDLKWTEAGWWHLEQIQQKKLFDIQCLWRAEQIVLPGIELGCDFYYWEKNILNCPFVDPITEDEVELYQQYLQTENVELEDELHIFLNVQNYDAIKDAFLNEESDYNFPEWFEFYNSRKGSASLLELPDIRGKKERFYLGLVRTPDKQKALNELSQVFRQPPGKHLNKDGLQFLNPHSDEILDFFVEAFEDKETKEYYRATGWAYRNREEKEKLEDDIHLLLDAQTPVPVEEHSDWKDAIEQAVRRYSIQLISEHLSEAFEQYQMNLSMNISFPEKNTDHIKAAKQQLTEEILRARKLNGEPEDLNF